MTTLPIESVLPSLMDKLSAGQNAVLVAPPGAGKTTRIPLALLDEPWLSGQRILLLEPRRLAARNAARYMARLLGEQVGQTVGYRVRHETKVGPKTRIEVITEGILTRILQNDPALEGIGIVIFDEFHERNLHADLGLALCLQSQSVIREDLKLLVMSATLDVEPISELLNHAPVIVSEGRNYPVETIYLDRPVQGPIETSVVQAIHDALTSHTQGDLLVFLPGAGEIRRVASQLSERGVVAQHVRVAPLYGNLPQELQDNAILPAKEGERKVVLSTSIAESSLTVEGVSIVIDSGLMRIPKFSPRTAMSHLETVAVSKASADQRRGRAGRLGPGICYRLWTESEDRGLAPHTPPEIMEADLAPLTLELAYWGITDPCELLWLNLPPKGAFHQAQELLKQLGAIHVSGAITLHGKQMAALGLHPRLAHMIVKAIPLRLGGLACDLAALLTERDLLRGEISLNDADLRSRIEILRSSNKSADPTVLSRVLAESNYWSKEMNIPPDSKEEVDCSGMLLAFAYPDRIAQRKGQGRFLLSNGRGAALPALQPLSNTPYLVAAELDDQSSESRIFLAAPVKLTELEQQMNEFIVEENWIAWDRELQTVRSRRSMRLGALLLKEGQHPNPGADQVLEALLEGIHEEGLDILPWTKKARQLQQRILLLRQYEPEWPDVTDSALESSLSDWLAPHLYGMKSREDLQRLNVAEILESVLSWNQRRELDECCPTHIVVPSGSRIPVDYSDPASPVLAVRLQELFGLRETPRIARGKLPLTLHLLSPAHRPVQVTKDLASFWQTTYFDVKKDLKGRYPKHYWPDDPYQAMPTNRVRPKN